MELLSQKALAEAYEGSFEDFMASAHEVATSAMESVGATHGVICATHPDKIYVIAECAPGVSRMYRVDLNVDDGVLTEGGLTSVRAIKSNGGSLRESADALDMAASAISEGQGDAAKEIMESLGNVPKPLLEMLREPSKLHECACEMGKRWRVFYEDGIPLIVAIGDDDETLGLVGERLDDFRDQVDTMRVVDVEESAKIRSVRVAVDSLCEEYDARVALMGVAPRGSPLWMESVGAIRQINAVTEDLVAKVKGVKNEC